MARSNTVKLSDEEKESLEKVRIELFSTEEVPFGVVIDKLVEDYND